MFMIGFFKKQAKSNIESKLKIGEMIKDAKESGVYENEMKHGSAVAEGTDKKEYEKRYSNLRKVNYILLFFMFLTAVIALFNLDVRSIIICIMTCILFGMFYFKYSFIAYRARYVYENWEEREKEHVIEVRDYMDALQVNPMDIFPLKLKKE